MSPLLPTTPPKAASGPWASSPWPALLFTTAFLCATAGIGSHIDSNENTAVRLLVKNKDTEIFYTVGSLRPAFSPDTLATAWDLLFLKEGEAEPQLIFCVGRPPRKGVSFPCLRELPGEALSETTLYRIGYVKGQNRRFGEKGKVLVEEVKVLVELISPTGRSILTREATFDSAIEINQGYPRWMLSWAAIFFVTAFLWKLWDSPIGVKVRHLKQRYWSPRISIAGFVQWLLGMPK